MLHGMSLGVFLVYSEARMLASKRVQFHHRSFHYPPVLANDL